MRPVAAIVVTYNHDRYVAETIASVLAQSVPPAQIVVADDGSTDRTLEIVRSFRDRRIDVLALPHRGIGSLADTYNAALARAHAELVAVLEGDDRWRPDHLAVHVRSFDDERVVLSHALYGVIGAHGTLLKDRVGLHVPVPRGPYDAFPLHLLMSYVMPLTAVVRRSALERIGGFQQLPGTPHTDHPTYLALSRVGLFEFHERVVADWRKHVRSGTMQLVGIDVTGTRRSLELALAACARSERTDLPDEGQIRREWDEALGRQLWHAARLLLMQRRFDEVAPLLSQARDASRLRPATRLRLALARTAARLHVNVEALARVFARGSAYDELD